MSEDERLNPNDPIDANLLSLKNSIESKPDWPAKKAEIERDHFIPPFSSTDRSSGTPVDKDDARNAALKANFESGRAQEAAPTSGESGPMDFNAARTKFGEVLGVVPGTPEFDGAVQTFAAWYDDVSTNPEFDNVVRAAEKMFGTEEVLRIAHRMAGDHAKRKSRR